MRSFLRLILWHRGNKATWTTNFKTGLGVGLQDDMSKLTLTSLLLASNNVNETRSRKLSSKLNLKLLHLSQQCH